MSKRFLILFSVALLLVASRARADTYDISGVAAGKILVALPDVLKKAVGASGEEVRASKPDNCRLKVTAEALERAEDKAGTCPMLWAQRELAELTIQFSVGGQNYTVNLTPAATKAPSGTLSLKDRVVTSTAPLPNNAELFVFTAPDKDKPWISIKFDHTAKNFALPSEVMLHGTELLYYFNDGTDFYYGTSIGVPPEAPKPVTNNSPPPAQAPMDCAPPPSGADHTQVICVDTYGEGENEKVTFVPDHGHVIRPNTDVVVRVRYPSDADLQIDMGGTVGLFAPSVLNETTGTATKAQAGGGAATTPHPVVREQSFAPRKPGDADITITLKQDGNESKHKVELIVEETYSGAVRVGVGFPFGGAVDGRYEARKLPGSQQAEIVSTTGGSMDFELTVAYAPYLDNGGRSEVRGCYPGCFNPFVAVGVWAPDATGTDFIKSVYAGGEWEPQPSVSVGLGFVLRRVTRLQDGFHVGSAVDGDVPTKTAIGFGGGLIVNFSPEFLRIAKPAASSFLK